MFNIIYNTYQNSCLITLVDKCISMPVDTFSNSQHLYELGNILEHTNMMSTEASLKTY